MKHIPLNLVSAVESRTGAAGRLKRPGDAVLVFRGVPRLLLLKCPCGCGDDLPVNIDARAGKAWRLYRERDNRLTLYPSVWRDTGCRSHFVLRRSAILLFASSSDDVLGQPSAEIIALAKRVLAIWPAYGQHNYVDVADQLGIIPWDVLEACELLSSQELLVEGTGSERGQFSRKR